MSSRSDVNCGAYFLCLSVGDDIMYLCPSGTTADANLRECAPDDTCNFGKFNRPNKRFSNFQMDMCGYPE